MGAVSTKAALVEYKTVKIKDKGYVETVPQLQVIGVGYDRYNKNKLIKNALHITVSSIWV